MKEMNKNKQRCIDQNNKSNKKEIIKKQNDTKLQK